MKSELVSAELYSQPAVLSVDSKRVMVACGPHIMTHNLKNGKLIDCSESVGAKVIKMVRSNKQLLVSDGSVTKSYENKDGTLSLSETLGSFTVVSSNGNISVVLSKSSDTNEITLGYIEGKISGSSKINPIYTGIVSRVAQSGTIIAAVIAEIKKTVFVYDIATKKSREFVNDHIITSIAVNPNGDEFATGNWIGHVNRYSLSSDSSSRYTSMHHWHSVPVAALEYSSKGTVLLSGAEEGVLCIWNSSSSKPQFIPRLGAAIAHITANHQYAAVSLKNNRIVVIDMFMRSIQSTITGVLHDGDHKAECVSKISSVAENIVAVSTPSHCQLFNLDTRTPLSLIPIQNRNHIPSTIRHKVKARPWECDHVAVLQGAGEDDGTWYMMATLTQATCGLSTTRPSGRMVKFFSSKDEGKTWSLQTIVTNGHMDEIVGIYAISAIGGFVSACRDGTLKIWSLSKSSNKSGDSFWMISKSATWRNRRVTSLSISRAGLVIVGFEQFITIWNPTNLLELTGGLLFAQDDILAAGLIEESTELISLTRSGIANLWDLKGLVKIGTANVDLTSSGAVIHTAIVENRLLIVPPAGESCGSMISVCRSSAPLIVESIIVGDAGAKISGLCPIGSSVLISTRRGKELFKLSSEVGGVFRTPEEEEMVIEENLDTTIDDSPQYPLSKSTKSRLVFEPMSSVIARLFPLENGLESLPSCEDSFNMLVGQLAAPKIATH